MWVFADIEGERELEVFTFNSTRQLMPFREVVDIQGELLIYTSTVLENDIGCSNIINPIIKRDAKECILLGKGDGQTLDAKYWTSAQSLICHWVTYLSQRQYQRLYQR